MRGAVLLLGTVLVLVSSAGAARVVGTDGPDTIVGTPRSDALFGRGGADRIFGLGGSDFLHGGPGRDLLDGGPGDDRIAAQYDGSRDRIRCGPGFDVVNADLLDVVAADCELVSRRLSRDPYTNPEGQHETQVEPDSLTVGRTTVTAYQVGRRFDGAATNVGFSVSSDGGRSWRSGLLPGLTVASRPRGPNERSTDPVVAYDAQNGIWLIGTLSLAGNVTRLTVSRSADGWAWDSPVVALEATAPQGIAFDKNWLVCDNGPASRFRGRCYLPYTDTLRDDRLAVLTSTDGGRTWTGPVGVPVTDAVGVFPVVQPSGAIVMPFLWQGRGIGATVSVDGGLSFEPPVLVSQTGARPARGLRFFPLPAADVDPEGRVWLTWHGCPPGRNCAANRIVISTSTDGRTWTPPAAVTSGRNAMLPAIGIHPGSGRVALAYHVVRAGGGVDVELLELDQSRRVLRPARRLSAQTMRPEWMPNTVSGRMLADYISVHYSGARPLVVWVLASEPVGSSFRQAVFATLG